MKKMIKKIYNKCKKILFRCADGIIEYKEAIELYDNGNAIIIDVKNEEEFAENHIEGAINIPVYDIANKIGNIASNKNDTIILYCKTGKRSKIAKDILEQEGYSNVYILYV